MKLASCCSGTRNVIDVIKACTALAMAIMTTVVLMLLMVIMMWGMLLTGLLLLLVAALVTSSAENATDRYVHISDPSAIDV
jgi:ABC-type multidrug transport system fused ATPase/permease subunit